MKILVAAYNRPKKLIRTLEFYRSEIFKNFCEVVVLDGSDDANLAKVIEVYCLQNMVEYRYNPAHFCDRIIDYCESLEQKEIIAVSPDEDVYLPDFLEYAENFLKNNPSFSAIVGRYVTFQKPLGPFSRISYSRDALLDYAINDVSPLKRAQKLFACLFAGCSPVFWGVRTAGNYLETCRIQKECQIGASMEVADQIVLALQGKIQFIDKLMMLRDETKIRHQHSEEHHNLNNYITLQECDILKGVALKSNYADMKKCVDMWCTIYEYDESNKKSIAMQWFGGNLRKSKSFTSSSLEKLLINIRYHSVRSLIVFYEIVVAYIVVNSLKRKYGRSRISSVTKQLPVS